MTPAEMSHEGARLSRLLDSALAFLKEQIPAAAAAERDYRKEKSKAWVTCPNDEGGVKSSDREWTASRREAWVNAETADLRYLRDVSGGMVRTGHQAVKARMYEISLLQSEMGAWKAEANFARTGPEMTP